MSHMTIPVQLIDLFWFECAFCHKEIERDAKVEVNGRMVNAVRRKICPHCKVGGSVKAIPQGPPGAWTKFFLWQEGKL